MKRCLPAILFLIAWPAYSADISVVTEQELLDFTEPVLDRLDAIEARLDALEGQEPPPPPPPPPPTGVGDIIVDNHEVPDEDQFRRDDLARAWSVSTVSFADVQHGPSTAFMDYPTGWFKWRFNIVTPGRYNVYEWHTEALEGARFPRHRSAPYVIDHTGGPSEVTVNQNENGGQFNLLGEFLFDAPGEYFVQVEHRDDCVTNADGSVACRTAYVSADAIKLEFVGP